MLAEAPDARFTLVGDDAIQTKGERLRTRFERRWAGTGVLARVAFTGRLDDDALAARYAACDVFVAPSRYESFGLTMLEAMIFAKPCVGLNAGATPEVVLDGETGLLVASEDVAALTEAIVALALDPERRTAMGRAGRARYEALFTAERMSTAVEQLLLGLRAPLIPAAASAGTPGRASGRT